MTDFHAAYPSRLKERLTRGHLDAAYAELRARAERAVELEDAIGRNQARFEALVAEAMRPDMAAAATALLAETVGLPTPDRASEVIRLTSLHPALWR